MKKGKLALVALCGTLMLAACGAGNGDPYRVDTVVQIPVDPTEAPTEIPEDTEGIPTEDIPVTTGPEEETRETVSSSGTSKSSSSGSSRSSSSGKNSGNSKSSSEVQTQPAATEPPATEPPTEAPAEPAYDPSAYSIGSLEYAILDAINAYRTEEGLGELSMSTKLCGIAALRAREVQQLWSHTRPDGRNYTSALSDYGYGYGAVTENLIYASGASGQQIVDKWMEKDNRNSLLSGDYTTAGIGVCTIGGVTYVANILVG